MNFLKYQYYVALISQNCFRNSCARV